MATSANTPETPAVPGVPGAPGSNTEPYFNLEKIYTKDSSLEVPNAPKIFLEQEAPQLETQINVEVNNFDGNMYEVCVGATVTTKAKDKVMFLVEVKEAGIFEIRNIGPNELEPVLNIHCANIVFPYLRANVADLITRAGFPVLHLPNINFEAYYQARLQQMAASTATPQ